MIRIAIVVLCMIIAMPLGISAAGAHPGTRTTTVPEGTITSDITWNAASSPYVIEGNVTISPTGSLSIDPGVTVIIGKGLRIGVEGKLLIKGTGIDNVTITDTGTGAFDGIYFSSGSYGRIDRLAMNGCKNGIDASGAGTIVHVLNSTVDADSVGIASRTGATVWAINDTIAGSPRLVVSSADIYEGWWLFFRAVLDNGNPWKGAELKATVYPESGDRIAYDSIGGPDPDTGADGRVRAIPIDEHHHSGSISSYVSKLYLRMLSFDPERQWTKNYGYLNITGNIEYTWILDNTAPPAPEEVSIIERGGEYLVIEWSWDHNSNDHQLDYFAVA